MACIARLAVSLCGSWLGLCPLGSCASPILFQQSLIFSEAVPLDLCINADQWFERPLAREEVLTMALCLDERPQHETALFYVYLS